MNFVFLEKKVEFNLNFRHGQWFAPVFQCDQYGMLPRDWIVTYTVPFFGRDQFYGKDSSSPRSNNGLEFRLVSFLNFKMLKKKKG
jgi:hypothetical protein